uniref:transposase n=1 Tax=Bacillus sp. FSL R5-0560 TaxID=2954588 RepID=UPI00403FC1D9
MITNLYFHFPNDISYKEYLLKLRWSKNIVCPYCSSIRNTQLKNKFRFHCNTCNANFSLTVNTIMHKSKIDLRKWLIALHLYLNDNKLTYRKLGSIIKVNKNTAHRMLEKIGFLFSRYRLAILKISGMSKDAIEVMSKMLILDIKERYHDK